MKILSIALFLLLVLAGLMLPGAACRAAAGTPPTLSVGAATATGTPAGITLSLSSALSGGSGSGYQYDIYRGTQPAVSTDGAPFATTASMPYTDAATSPGILYFYKIVGVDSSGSRVYVPPAGLGNVSVSTSTSLVVSAVRPGDIMNIVFGGDSITYGATLPSPSTEAPPVLASQCLESINGIRAVYFSNQGYGGTTTTDFLPSTQKVFPALISAATKLQAANPTGQLVFSLMLGTNDSASTTVNGPAPSLAHFEANYDAIVDQLLSTFPSAKIVIHYPPLYSPNTHNGANYEEAGLARLFEYQHGIDQVVAHESRLHRGHVFAGDKTAPTYFASVYQSELTAEQGQNGTFYLHPNQKGAADLGRLWAIAIYNATVGANAHR